MGECDTILVAISWNPDTHTMREAEPAEYQAVVGWLMYIALATRPDISFAVSALSRYSTHPHESQLTAAGRVLRFSDRQLTTAYISGVKATARSQATWTPMGKTTAQTTNRKGFMCSF